MYFYASNPGAPGVRPFWSQGHFLKKTWYRTIRQCYISDFKHIRQVFLRKKIVLIFSNYLYDSNLGLSEVRPFKTPRATMQHIKLKKSEHSGSEDFEIFFLCTSMV